MERFTISLDAKLAHEFDEWIADRGYSNRSEAVRDLLRAELGRPRSPASKPTYCVACLSYVFNHHERDLPERLTQMQHEHHDLAVATMHVHLDHDHCLETVLLRGQTNDVQRFADNLCAERGVHHGNLNLIGAELHQAQRHAAEHGHSAPAGKQPRNGRTRHVHLKPQR
jgi:CopG family nickel-responsive transcriptional regulator